MAVVVIVVPVAQFAERDAVVLRALQAKRPIVLEYASIFKALFSTVENVELPAQEGESVRVVNVSVAQVQKCVLMNASICAHHINIVAVAAVLVQPGRFAQEVSARLLAQRVHPHSVLAGALICSQTIDTVGSVVILVRSLAAV
ncbi:MAG: hypothetical protein AAGJ35_05995 [Myxococcota bacterium]